MTQLALTLLAAALYVAAAVRVRLRRGTFDPLRATSFALGIALLLVAFLSPLDRLGEERYFSAHMAQHLLIGDLAPLFCVLGLSGPLLRPALALRPVRALRVLTHPLVALPLWAVDLVAWHTTPLYDAALDHDAVHALQHLLFFTCGALLWSALLELLPGPRWFRLPHRLGYVAVMWLVSLALSQVFLWSGHAYYSRYGGDVNDQRVGGGIMLLEGSLVMISVLAWLLWRELRPGSISTASVAQPKPVAPLGVPSCGS
jgi:putative membrane protein